MKCATDLRARNNTTCYGQNEDCGFRLGMCAARNFVLFQEHIQMRAIHAAHAAMLPPLLSRYSR
jgi:hypothetical protein